MTTKEERRFGNDLYTFKDEEETEPDNHGVENAIRGTVGNLLLTAPEIVLGSQYYPYPADKGSVAVVILETDDAGNDASGHLAD